MINSRALLVIAFILILFTVLTVKLVEIQIIKSEELTYLAKKQQTKLETIPAERGVIYDRNNTLLVYNRNDVSVYLDLRVVPKNSKNTLAKKLSSTFGRSKSYYKKLMNQSGKTIRIEKSANREKAFRLINDINLSALFTVENPTRVYQYGSLASHILGYVNNDFVGVNGIAKTFEEDLNGDDGALIVERDIRGRIITTIQNNEVKIPIPGHNLKLTIDINYQAILEDELKRGNKFYKGESATGIIMDPNTGEILALANVDDYDPNYYWKFSDSQRKNKAITDTYEPGSTIKAITLAALLDMGKCSENELVNVENGKYKFRNTYIRDTHKNNYLSVSGILEESSNIGISKLIQRLDDDTYYKYLRGFGFGTYTSVTLPGEVKGILKKPNQWSKLTKTFMSFGYGVSVTPLQLVMAYSAIVNGGILYEPHILKSKTDKSGVVKYESSPVAVRRVISEETSARVKKILRRAVKNGTGHLADLEEISVGGKTGTSQQIINGKYSQQKYHASFIGFFPADNPQLVCLVIVNAPQTEKYGGKVAAPIFKKIAGRIINTDLKNFQQREKYIESNSVDKHILNTISDNDNKKKIINASHVQKNNELNKNYVNNLMPDLTGRTIKEALISLNLLGLKYDIRGSGIVVSQSINPGINLKQNQVCRLNFSEATIKGANIY
ncbi:MAG: penicillin-binding transpeptidase domain-containing protein [Ignavibacteria bacterium]|nr:MAG: penicillin-binding transpeptidase domain-containing protein [Ignavibacteria bacterium]